MSNFREMAPPMDSERMFEKISNFKIMNILHIILKHVVWRFRIYNYFRENMSKIDFAKFL